MEDFGSIMHPLLKAFIVAHDPKLTKMKDVPKKGKVKDAVEHEAHNAISMAYKCRMLANIVVGNKPRSAEERAKVRDDDSC